MEERNSGSGGALKLLRTAISKSGKPASIIAAVGGFVSDVLQPLAPVGIYLALIAAATAILTGFIAKRTRGSACASVFPFSAIAAVVLGLFSVVTSVWPERGAVASAIPAVGDLQDRLFKIQESVDRIETAVVGVSGKIDDVQQSVGRIEQSMDAVGRSGALVISPASFEDYWNNAKVHAKNGQYLDARADYRKCIEFNPPFLDPYLDYAAILRSQDGYDAARRGMEGVAKSASTPSAVFAALTLLDGEEKQARLTEFLKQHQDFLPAYIELFHVLNDRLRNLEMESQALLGSKSKNGVVRGYAPDEKMDAIEASRRLVMQAFVEAYRSFSKTPVSRDDFMRYYLDKDRIPLDAVWSLQTWKDTYQLLSTSLNAGPSQS